MFDAKMQDSHDGIQAGSGRKDRRYKSIKNL
jgi:hypothetical protein